MYIFKIKFSVYIKVIHTYTFKKIHLCLKITFSVYIKVIHTYTFKKIHLCLKITFSVYIKVIHTYTIKINLCLKLSFFISFFLSDGTQGNKHTEQFPGTDGEG